MQRTDRRDSGAAPQPSPPEDPAPDGPRVTPPPQPGEPAGEVTGAAPGDPGTADVEILLEVYGWLRDEINESYERQHRLVLGEATLVGLAIGLQFGFDRFGTSPDGAALVELLRFVLLAVPPLVIVTASLWLLEHNRVMRAGNYLQLLEYQINESAEGNPVSWETWLRDPPSRPTIERIRSPDFVFDVCHFIGYPAFFLVTGTVSLALVAKQVYGVPMNALGDPSRLLEVLSGWGGGTIAYFLVLTVVLLSIIGLTVCQIPHQWHDQSDRVHAFDAWLSRRFDATADEVDDG